VIEPGGNEAAVHQALRDAVCGVLEKMFFAETMGELAATEPAGQEITVELDFEGEPSGALLLRLTSQTARQIAADFLGIDECGITETQTFEVVRELANMVCGSILSRVESAAAFRLAPARIVTPETGIARFLSNVSYCVRLSNGILAVNLGTGILTCQQPALSAC
jgi:CheY-specific phosphatase CheX